MGLRKKRKVRLRECCGLGARRELVAPHGGRDRNARARAARRRCAGSPTQILARELRGRKLGGSGDVRPRYSVVGFCLRREVADVFERLLSGEPASDRKGVNGEAEEGEDIDLSAPSDWRTVGLLVLVFVVNIALINLLGWVISGAMLFYGTAWVLGSRHYIRNIFISFALSLITFYGFYVGLGVHLPAGILQGIL